MGFFHSPMKLIRLIKDSGSIAKELKEKDADWYFSKEGEKAYKNAKTPAQKTMYFFDYLMAVSKSKDNRDILYRVAYIMANSMDSSSLEFGGYPNILDSTKNPLVNYIETTTFISSIGKTYYGLELLAALNHETNSKKFHYTKHKPYTRLTYCEADGSMTDKYKIERDIIGAFCIDFSNNKYEEKYMPPYMYEIVESSNDDEND